MEIPADMLVEFTANLAQSERSFKSKVSEFMQTLHDIGSVGSHKASQVFDLACIGQQVCSIAS